MVERNCACLVERSLVYGNSEATTWFWKSLKISPGSLQRILHWKTLERKSWGGGPLPKAMHGVSLRWKTRYFSANDVGELHWPASSMASNEWVRRKSWVAAIRQTSWALGSLSGAAASMTHFRMVAMWEAVHHLSKSLHTNRWSCLAVRVMDMYWWGAHTRPRQWC